MIAYIQYLLLNKSLRSIDDLVQGFTDTLWILGIIAFDIFLQLFYFFFPEDEE
jgi:hypothetical protein